MDTPGAPEGTQELRQRLNAPGVVTGSEIEEGGDQKVLEVREADERLLADPEEEKQRKEREEEERVAKEREEAERVAKDPEEAERVAKERVANEREEKQRVAEKTIFAETEEKLEVYDENERLLAETYRKVEKKRKEQAQARRERDGVYTYNPVESDLDSNDDGSCYVEIKNLVLIEKSLIHKTALEEWARKETLFTRRVERKTKKVGNLKNEVYQSLGFFSVFQGVVLTAVSQSNLLHCNNKWSPIFLSVLAGFVTIAGVLQKLLQIWPLEKTIYSEEQALKDVVHRGQELRREGKDFVFAKFSENKKKEPKEKYFWLYAILVISFLVIFTVAFPISHWRILCHPGPNPYSTPPPPPPA